MSVFHAMLIATLTILLFEIEVVSDQSIFLEL